MNFFKGFSKTLNKSLSKSLTVYKNNTRVIRNKSRGWEKKFLKEAKEFTYELLIFLETRRGWYAKWFGICVIASFAYQPLCFIFRKYKNEMLHSTIVIQQFDSYQKDNLSQNPADEHNTNKIMYSYWTNYL